MADKQKQASGKNHDTIQFASFLLGETHCGIDISLVQEINEDLNITKVPLSPDYVVGIMNLRGQIVTIIDQSMKIGFKTTKIGKSSRVVIVKSQDESVGLLVDKISEVITTSKSEISEPPSNVKGAQGKFFTGIVHTEKNELMALLNVEKILEV